MEKITPRRGELIIRVAKLVNEKVNLTLYGFIVILNLIYSLPNNREQSKDPFGGIDKITSYFLAQAQLLISGHTFIQPVYSRDTQPKVIVGWKCRRRRLKLYI